MSEIEFKGKEFVRNHHLSVPYRTLEPDAAKSVGKATLDGNLIIHGDNLHALKSLLPMYAGKVNCIYIDPPYNTGNEGWCYNDNVNSPQMQEWLTHNPVGVEDGLRHDKWLCMMWPRLQLLHQLLAEDGVIFISIDDNEQHRLRILMDEIFGGENFYAMVTWSARNKPMNAGVARFKFQKSEEYILVYGKISMKEHVPFNLAKSNEREYPFKDKNSLAYREEEIQQRKNIGIKKSDKMVFIINGVSPQAGYRWTIGEDTAHDIIEQNRVVIKNNKVFRIIYKNEEENFAFHPLWANFNESCGSSESGKLLLDKLCPSHGFETVKPVDLIKKIIFHFSNKNAMILDSFAGSGTTAQAVLELNREDGGKRKFILVECEDYADNITAERVRRVIKGVKTAKDQNLKEGLGGEFSYCELGEATDMDKLLTGERLPSFTALGALLFHTATRAAIDNAKIDQKIGYLGTSPDYHLWMIYQPDLAFLKSNGSALTLDKAQAIAKAKQDKKRHLVFAPATFVSSKTLNAANNGGGIAVDYQPLPWSLYRVVGN